MQDLRYLGSTFPEELRFILRTFLPAPALVATLVADPEKSRLSDALIGRTAQAVEGFIDWGWLDEGVAARVDRADFAALP